MNERQSHPNWYERFKLTPRREKLAYALGAVAGIGTFELINDLAHTQTLIEPSGGIAAAMVTYFLVRGRQ